MSNARILFIHHSVGRQLLDHGNVRARLRGVELYDHDYNRIGLRDADGQPCGKAFPIPDDDTDPPALARLFSGTDPAVTTAREQVLGFDVVAMKSCYPNSAIRTDEDERSRIATYQQLIESLASISREFVLVTSPPLVPLRTSNAQAARAARISNWLANEAAAGVANVSVFDLFGRLAGADGKLHKEFRRTVPFDAHPNERAWVGIGEPFAESLMGAAARVHGVMAG